MIHVALLSRLEAFRNEKKRNRNLSKPVLDKQQFNYYSSGYTSKEMEKDRQNMVQSVLDSSVLDSSGEYSIINYWIKADSFRYNNYHIENDVTLITMGSLSSLHHLTDLVERWKGFISFSLFSLPNDILTAIKLIILLRKCFPVIRYNTSFHLILPLHNLSLQKLKNVQKDNTNKPWHTSSYNLPSLSSCVQSSQIFASIQAKSSINYDINNGVPFPNNLLRNVARRNCLTEYIFVIDIDLLPSNNLHQDFLIFAKENHLFDEEGDKKKVFVVPSFEAHSSLSAAVIPKSKPELLNALKSHIIRPFYFQICWKCQKYTDYEAWEKESYSPKLAVAFEVSWHDPWEPFYISHNSVPMYDERFRQYGFNRISQVCELYVSGHKFSVLNNAFLVHKGMKEADLFHKTKDMELERNRILFRHFKKELRDKYPTSNRQC